MDTSALLRYFEKLRDELVSQQNTRSRFQIFKATAIGLLFYFGVNSFQQAPVISLVAFVLAPLIGVLFDFNIEGCSLAIKKIGYFVRNRIEPVLFVRAQSYELFMIRPYGMVRLPGLLFSESFTIVTFVISAFGLLFSWGGVKEFFQLPTWTSMVALGFGLLWAAGFWFGFVRSLRFSELSESFNCVDGEPGDQVLIPGQYEEWCRECRRVIGQKSVPLTQGVPFPPITVSHRLDHRQVTWQLRLS